jgi:hypothetical protein
MGLAVTIALDRVWATGTFADTASGPGGLVTVAERPPRPAEQTSQSDLLDQRQATSQSDLLDHR